MKNCSPLRYPGGKTRLVPVIENKLSLCESKIDVFAEAFAGGAGISLSLLFSSKVKSVILNDLDPAVFAFWNTVIHNPDYLISKIKNTSIDIHEYLHQREIYCSPLHSEQELAFAFFFLNRTNRSGILKGGPIGGYSQAGNYKLDSRFNKESLISKITAAAQLKDRIQICNMSVFDFLPTISQMAEKSYLYLDPPYYEKGNALYNTGFSKEDHIRLRDMLMDFKDIPWLLSYDDAPEILELYNNFKISEVSLIHNVSNKGKKKELLIQQKSSE